MTFIKRQHDILAKQQQRYVPLFIKIDPDLTDLELEKLVKTVVEHNIDAVIASNSTLQRERIREEKHSDEKGGLSGEPLRSPSAMVIGKLHKLQPQLPLIAVGGIMSGHDAQQTMDAGAQLIQVYTGLVYRGPQLIAEIANSLTPYKDVCQPVYHDN